MSLISTQTDKKLVITLHGIRTFAPWQKDLADELSKAGFYTKSLHYGYFSGIKLILPSRRKKQIEWLRDQYTQITREYPGVVPSIIAHSFGTYMVASALEMFDGIKFDQIILCGSIIPQDFNWDELVNSNQINRVLNECAKKDIVVRIAPWFIQDAGSSGAHGFDQQSAGLYQRFVSKFGHSDYLHTLNFTANWFPFLRGSSAPRNRPPGSQRVNWRFWVTAVFSLLLLSGLIIGAVKISQPLINRLNNTVTNTNISTNPPIIKDSIILSGTVVDSSERPIQEAQVSIDEMPGMKPVETSTDGVFSIPDIAKKYGESVRIRVVKNGYQPNPYTQDVVLGTVPPRIVLRRKR
jgi:hypothetical protein